MTPRDPAEHGLENMQTKPTSYVKGQRTGDLAEGAEVNDDPGTRDAVSDVRVHSENNASRSPSSMFAYFKSCRTTEQSRSASLYVS
jgi:hypothetical protein